MKRSKVIAVILTLTMVLGSATTAFAAIDYNQWNSQATYPQDVVGTQLFTPVKALMDRKIITGDADGLFHPEKKISRSEFATMMAKATNNIGDLTGMAQKNIFSDLNGYAWAKPYINACAGAGIIEGVGNGNFAPGKEVSYAEVITIIVRTKQGHESLTQGAWPDNFIRYAQMYNMMGDIVVYDWNSSVTKGDVAKLMYRNMPKASSDTATISLSTTTPTTAGSQVTVTAHTMGSGTHTYVWEIGGVVQGGNTNQMTWTPATADDYTVTVTVTATEVGKAATISKSSIKVTVVAP